MIGPQNLLQAKQALSANLLRAGLRGGVVGMAAAMTVERVIARAGHNVHAVGIGRKIVDGKVTPEQCVRVYVIQKVAESLLPPIYRIPASVDGIPTDVIESPPAFLAAKRKPRAAAAAPACSLNRQKRQRPVVAGISTGHFQITAGTLGYFCRSTETDDDPDDVFVLSNNHVYANVNQGRPGDDLYQPGPLDNGTPADTVAALTRFVPIQLGGTVPNRVDCAIGRLRPEVTRRVEVCSIGRIAGVAAAAEGTRVRKHGRTSGYTEGEVTDASYDALVGMDPNNPNTVALFQNQMRVERIAPFPAFALGGDSGSLVVAEEELHAVGLFFACPPGGSYGIANHIQDVLNELHVRLL